MCRNETRLLPKRHVLTLRKYTLIECLAQDVLNEKSSIYLYIVDFRTELSGLCFLTSYDRTYIMPVNTNNTVTDFPEFKHFLFFPGYDCTGPQSWDYPLTWSHEEAAPFV